MNFYGEEKKRTQVLCKKPEKNLGTKNPEIKRLFTGHSSLLPSSVSMREKIVLDESDSNRI